MSSIFDRFTPTSIHNVTFASTSLAKVVGNIVTGKQQTHLLLHGDPGTGKSKIAELLIAAMYPATAITKSYVFDGDEWTTSCTAQVEGTMNAWKMTDQIWHFTVINEVDRLNADEIGNVRCFMDKHLDHKFILTTNHVGKLPSNFQNRCSAHHVDMEPAASVAHKVCQVFADHGKFISPADALVLVSASKGSWRSLENLVHQFL
ncbi:MAG: replication factor large subunit [Devosia sp.]|uniref:AAA family ATPase n=1 Tax=Devosia sp. TaxID=1871048 RepID=UPI00261D0945|nr:AAA family ATPase [Devosia sp.]MDB5585907.1 replication factor large subunit [Devosia sp.]